MVWMEWKKQFQIHTTLQAKPTVFSRYTRTKRTPPNSRRCFYQPPPTPPPPPPPVVGFFCSPPLPSAPSIGSLSIAYSQLTEMEIHACLGQCENAHIPSTEFPNMNANVMEEEEALDLPSPPPSLHTNSKPCLSPVTPDSSKESAQVISNSTSPFATFSSPPRLDQIDGMSSSTECCTPKEAVFDPFAAGPDNLMLAPHCTKQLKESLSFIPRRLNFHSSYINDGDVKCASDEAVSDEDTLLEAVYETLLQAIISKQVEEEMLPEISNSSSPSLDGFKTPTSVPRLNGIAETCPGAPLKPERKLRHSDLSLCRKLEF